MNINNIKNLDIKCCGCSACYNICPVHAIDMIYNAEGFLYPKINDGCVQCGKCYQICNNELPQNAPIVNELIWCQHKDDEIRYKSSSGGFFYESAMYTLRRGGMVFGSIMNDDLSVCHCSAKNETELNKMLRSKYIQSETKSAYQEVKKILIENREVLFSGTPCQIEGLKKYLEKVYENLITIDFVCHGIPSTKVYEDMIDFYEHKYKKKITKVTFREKIKGWREEVLTLYFADGSSISKKAYQDYFFATFLSSKILRKSCLECDFAENHVSDITMSDFWGAKAVDNLGTSLLKINTDKGKQIFLNVSDKYRFGYANFMDAPFSFISHKKMKEYDFVQRNLEFNNYFKSNYKTMQGDLFPIAIKKDVFNFIKKIRGKLGGIKRRLFQCFRRKNK